MYIKQLSMKHLLVLFITFSGLLSYAQVKTIDGIVAVMGDKKILQSDIENQYVQLKLQGAKVSSETRCEIFEELLIQKLMVNQAEIDSIEVSDAEVEMQLEQRIDYFMQHFGTRDKMEEYFNKSIYEMKDDMFPSMKEQILTERMKGEIISGTDVTPSEVKKFYKTLPEDSIPYIDGTIEFSQVVIYPPYGEEAIYDVRQRLLEIRRRILDGDNFKTMAVLYSEGPSASRGGELGFASKAELDPEYARVAFSLKEGQVSKIVETDFGFHIIQMIEKRGDLVNTRHIIMKPKVSAESRELAINKLDSLAQLIKKDSISFDMVAKRFSEDEDSKLSGGRVVNMQTGNYKWEIDHFNPEEYQVLKDMEEGEVSDPFLAKDNAQKDVYKIVRLRKKTPPHKADLKQDYALFKNAARSDKQMRLIDEWIIENMNDTYIRINDSYKSCNFRLSAWLKEN